MTAIVGVSVFLILLLAGVPLFIVIGILSAVCLHLEGYPLMMVPQQMFSITEKEVLLAIPFFVLASVVMTRGRSAEKIIKFLSSLVDWLPGGLAVAAIAGCIFFAAVSGLSPTAVIAMGGMMFPALVGARFTERFSTGLLTAAGSLGILVPPSIVVIIFGIVGEVNIQHLFVAGLAPILIIALLFGIYSVVISHRAGVERSRFSFSRMWGSFFGGFWALLSSVFIAGIYTGWFSVTQASALVAGYVLFVEIVIYRSIAVRQLPEIFRRAATVAGTILIIIATAMSFNWFLTVEGVPMHITEFITAHFSSRIGFLIAVNVLLLFLGCIMDIMSAIFITVPLLLPAATALGIDPIHFGIVFIVNFEIGYLTPPVGINLFAASAVFRKEMVEVARAVLPFLVLLLIALILVTYFPDISLWMLRFF
ncbi:MAG: TRAP transporter large permease subunit [bacterium]